MTLPVVSLCRLSGTVRCGSASGKGFSGDRPCTKWVSASVIDGSSSPSRPRTEAKAGQLTRATLSVLSPPPCALLRRYPIFENPYPLTIHESPVTCCEYFADCPVDLIPALYSVGSRQKRQGYSKKVRFTPGTCVVFICDVSVAMGISIMKLYVNISTLLFTCEAERTEL